MAVGAALTFASLDLVASCPEWIRNRAASFPLCSASGLVSENHPLAVITVSDLGRSGKDSGFTADVVEKVLRNSPETPPLILLPVSDQTLTLVRDRILSLAIDQKQKNKYLKSLQQVPADSYTWQQDFLQPTVNPKTGQVILRSIDSYDRGKPSSQAIVDAVKDCGFTAGPAIRAKNSENRYMGGNIESLPGGICVIGNQGFEGKDWAQLADQVCGSNPEDRIQAPSQWLFSGHADDLVHVIRNPKREAPCDFSLVVASPTKALELLQENPNDVFFDTSGARGNSKQLAIERSNQERNFRDLCHRVRDLRYLPSDEQVTPAENAKGFSLWFLLQSWAWAQDKKIIPPLGVDLQFCSRIKNAQVSELFRRDPSLRQAVALIEDELKAFRQDIQDKLKKKFPKCETDFIDAPVLYIGKLAQSGAGVTKLPEGFTSVLPNPVNGITVNDAFLSPDPANTAFKKYLKGEYGRRGVATEFVDSFDYGHRGKGNLHCATNSIHLCRPSGL